MIDLLIAGGGPAGLATAICAARAGLDAVVAEPRETPVDKACGEGLMPGAVRALAALGVDVEGHQFRGIRYVQGGTRVDAPFRAGHGLGVRRTSLHAALADRVDELGIRVVSARIADVDQRQDRVRAAGLTARYLVAADGLHSPVRRAVGVETRRRGATRYGLRAHFAVPPWSDFVEVHWAERSEAYVTPVGPDCVGVALLTGGRGPYPEQLRGFPAVAERLPPVVGEVLGAGPLRQDVRSRVAGRVLFVGDAAGYVDALTGEGIALALASAAELVRCVRTDRVGEYEHAWRRVTRTYRLLTRALVTARSQPRLAPHIVPAAARLPRLFRAAVDLLA